MKKTVALILTVAMVFSLCIPALAVENYFSITADAADAFKEGDIIEIRLNILPSKDDIKLAGFDILIDYNDELLSTDGNVATWNAENASVETLNQRNDGGHWSVLGYDGANGLSVTVLEENAVAGVSANDELYIDLVFTAVSDSPADGDTLITFTNAEATSLLTEAPYVEVVNGTADSISVNEIEYGNDWLYIAEKGDKYYFENEEFDISDWVFKTKTGDVVEVVDNDNITVTGFDSKEAGACEIRFTYTDDEAHVIYSNVANVRILEPRPDVLHGIKLEVKPVKLIYKVGEEFEATGLRIRAQMSATGYVSISDLSQLTVTGFDSSTKGLKTLIVDYQGQTTQFSVRIVS